MYVCACVCVYVCVCVCVGVYVHEVLSCCSQKITDGALVILEAVLKQHCEHQEVTLGLTQD